MTDNNFDFNKICRICLKENNFIQSISLQYKNSIKFIEMIEYLIGNKICDLKVDNICNECTTQLILSYEFKQKCLHSNEIISKISSDFKEPVISDDSNSIDTIYFVDESDDLDNTKTAINESEPVNINAVAYQIDNGDDNIIGNSENKSIQSNTKSKSGIRQCLKCNLEFSNFKAYSIHHRQFHKSKVLCPLCGKLVAKHSLEKHLASRIHNKNKEHLCTECGKSFTLLENLEKHLRIHTGDKRYICEHCNMKFIHWNSKRSHIRSFHTGEKKYECSICSKRFAQSSNLFRHIRSHTGEMPHECSFCNKKFKTSPELRNHLVVHTKERNHICNVCNKAFGTKKALLAHNKIHTGERNYLCTVCGRAFTQAHVLRTHLKTHPNCPIPPAGAVLSQKAINKPKKFLDLNSSINTEEIKNECHEN